MVNLTKKSRIGFIGAGMVGKSLAVALARHGYPVAAAASRTPASARDLADLVPGCTAHEAPGEVAEATDVVFVTTPDDAIGTVASGLSWRPGQGVVHCSGVASLDILEPARRQGAIPGAVHPLQTFSSVEDAVKSLPGTTFAIEGDPPMRAYLKDMAEVLGGIPIFLRPQDKPLYHASVAMVGGLLTGLAGAVADLWGHFGIDRSTALKSLAPLIAGDAITLQSVGVPGALAGPYVRGDVGTISKHLDSLKALAPEMLPIYCHMALTAMPFAFEKGKVSEERAAEIRGLLHQALGTATK